MLKGIGHIGIAVRDMESVLDKLCTGLGLDRPAINDLPHRGMKVAVLPLGSVSLEIIEDYTTGGFFYDRLQAEGNFIHHFCLISDDLEEDIATLKARGVKMMHDEPRLGLRGKKIAFTAPDILEGIPIELSEP